MRSLIQRQVFAPSQSEADVHGLAVSVDLQSDAVSRPQVVQDLEQIPLKLYLLTIDALDHIPQNDASTLVPAQQTLHTQPEMCQLRQNSPR